MKNFKISKIDFYSGKNGFFKAPEKTLVLGYGVTGPE